MERDTSLAKGFPKEFLRPLTQFENSSNYISIQSNHPLASLGLAVANRKGFVHQVHVPPLNLPLACGSAFAAMGKMPPSEFANWGETRLAVDGSARPVILHT